MPSKLVQIAEIGSVTLRKSRRNRFIRLSINHDGAIKVTMPPWVPYKVGIEFAKTKKHWIQQRAPRTILINHGDHIGKNHVVEFMEASGDSVRSTVNKSHIRLFIPERLDKTDPTVQTSVQKAAHKALKQQAELFLPERVQQLAGHYGFNYKNVSIKKLKSRWGSCNDKQELVFNYYLMQLPWNYIDYVILHELTHTKIMAHDNKFWSQLSRVLPGASEYRHTIKQYRPVLMPLSVQN